MCVPVCPYLLAPSDAGVTYVHGYSVLGEPPIRTATAAALEPCIMGKRSGFLGVICAYIGSPLEPGDTPFRAVDLCVPLLFCPSVWT